MLQNMALAAQLGGQERTWVGPRPFTSRNTHSRAWAYASLLDSYKCLHENYTHPSHTSLYEKCCKTWRWPHSSEAKNARGWAHDHSHREIRTLERGHMPLCSIATNVCTRTTHTLHIPHYMKSAAKHGVGRTARRPRTLVGGSTTIHIPKYAL